jgi:hypothetical protein
MSFVREPLDRAVADWWSRIPSEWKNALLAVLIVSVLAHGFEMTNLTLHHDDVVHLLVDGPLVGHFLGRFGFTWIFHYAQGGHYSPFLHMAIGMLATAAYGFVICRLWNLRKTLDIALVTSLVCVFPYTAQIYQYNSAMIAFPLAHLLAALGVMVAVSGGVARVLGAGVLFVGAFSIYQAVLANAVTIFVLWFLTRVLFPNEAGLGSHRSPLRGAIATALAGIIGGVVYVTIVASMGIEFGPAQAADKAFSLEHRLQNGLQLSRVASEALAGTKAFFLWPESYLPSWVKVAQLALLVAAAGVCLLLPGRPLPKMAAITVLGIAVLAPRTMQLLHPQGRYHSLTLTAYAVVIAGAVMVLARSGLVLMRNASAVVAVAVIIGYVAQCNWISTVNYLNTLAHYTTLTQILSRLRALPEGSWDGRRVAVVGKYEMSREFPFKPATGVASTFLDASHMNSLARFMRDEARFVDASSAMPRVMAYAATRDAWPHPASVGVVDGTAVVILSKK